MGWEPLWAWLCSVFDPQDSINELLNCVLQVSGQQNGGPMGTAVIKAIYGPFGGPVPGGRPLSDGIGVPGGGPASGGAGTSGGGPTNCGVMAIPQGKLPTGRGMVSKAVLKEGLFASVSITETVLAREFAT